MCFAVVLVDAIRRNVPATIAAAGCFIVAAVAEERAAQEELFQPASCLVVQFARIERHMHLMAAAFARS